MQKNIVIVGTVAGILLLIDLVGMISWMFSGQIPPDSFYLGSTSKNIILFIINLFVI